MANYLIALVLGAFFGFSLNKAGLTKYYKIVNVFRLTDLAVLKFMMTALVVAMSGLYVLRGLGMITFPSVPSTYIVGNVVGGLIFGVGMALSGYCPGTCAAGAGEGKLDYLIPGFLGFLVGAVFFGLTYQQVMPKITALAKIGNVDLPDLWNLNPYLFIFLFGLIAVLLFYAIDRGGFHRKEN
ncbi:MAG TPA: YeeE/YedE thiosulfate transporter family protein [Anaerolineales bacterium]